MKLTLDESCGGPPDCGNGGYICGTLAAHIPGPTRVVLQAPAPLGQELSIEHNAAGAALIGPDGTRIATASRADALPAPPTPPDYRTALAASAGFPGFSRAFHPDCLPCRLSPPGESLRAFAGQIAGAATGNVAGEWIPHPAYCDDDGFASLQAIWGALDCSGAVAWVVSEGGQGGWLGTMTGLVQQRPTVGQACILTAWRIGQSGRKRLSGTALHLPDGTLLAHSEQIWLWPA